MILCLNIKAVAKLSLVMSETMKAIMTTRYLCSLDCSLVSLANRVRRNKRGDVRLGIGDHVTHVMQLSVARRQLKQAHRGARSCACSRALTNHCLLSTSLSALLRRLLLQVAFSIVKEVSDS